MINRKEKSRKKRRKVMTMTKNPIQKRRKNNPRERVGVGSHQTKTKITRSLLIITTTITTTEGVTGGGTGVIDLTGEGDTEGEAEDTVAADTVAAVGTETDSIPHITGGSKEGVVVAIPDTKIMDIGSSTEKE